MKGSDDADLYQSPEMHNFSTTAPKSESGTESEISESSDSESPNQVLEIPEGKSLFSSRHLSMAEKSQIAESYMIRNLATGDFLDMCDEAKAEFGAAFACLIDETDHVAKYKRIL